MKFQVSHFEKFWTVKKYLKYITEATWHKLKISNSLIPKMPQTGLDTKFRQKKYWSKFLKMRKSKSLYQNHFEYIKNSTVSTTFPSPTKFANLHISLEKKVVSTLNSTALSPATEHFPNSQSERNDRRNENWQPRNKNQRRLSVDRFTQRHAWDIIVAADWESLRNRKC